jgi:hypothetical protein
MERRPEKSEVKGGMRVRTYDVFHRAVEEGIEQGWRRAHKHTDTPSEDAIKDEILQGILNAVCEYFDFDDEARP